jgi:hypothetical protein
VILGAVGAHAQTSTKINVPITITQDTNGAVTVTAQGTTIVIPPVSSSTAPPPAGQPPAPPPPAVPPAGGQTSWIYHNGVFLWPGDWSGAVSSINYADTVGKPGAKDIAFRTNGAFGYWLPYAAISSATHQPSFDTTPYHHLTISIKPTSSSQTYSLGAYRYSVSNGQFEGDISTGAGVTNVGVFCVPKLTSGSWSVCTIPLASLQAANLSTFYKFIFQDQSGQAGLTTYLDAIGFTQ